MNTKYTFDSGRSMVEILGVLVIIGVLSIGGIMGYNYAIAKNKANEITSELNLRAIVLSQQQTQSPKPAETTLTMEMGNTMKFGNEVSAKVSVNPEYFEITVADVEKQACELILQDYTTSAWMIINGTLYENTPTVCDTDKNTMTFVYKNDLGEKRNCATKGFFNITSYKCECAGGTYFDNTAKDCVCPAGTKWTGSECTESRCGDNEFEALDGGCVSCEDPESYSIAWSDPSAMALCNACPNRIASNKGCYYNHCNENEFLQSDGRCLSCNGVSNVDLGVDEGKICDICLACGNRFISKARCIHKDYCPDGFLGSKEGGGYTCFTCDEITSRITGTDTFAHNKCTACGNRSVIEDQNKYYCAKTTCDSDEFKGKDGICYKCTDGAVVAVDIQMDVDGNITSSECQKCANRSATENGMCIISDCPSGTYTKLSDGSCYDCSQETAFKSTQEECETGCASMGRRWTSLGWCKLNMCQKGENYSFAGDLNTCYPCRNRTASDGSAYSGNSDWAKEYCEEGCGNYIAGGWCYEKDSCERGSQFRAGTEKQYRFCTSCDYTEKVKMAGHEEHDKMCADCVTTPRFFADNYCYRCDSSESPVVTTAEERASCTKCPNRQINAEGKCELIKTEE